MNFKEQVTKSTAAIIFLLAILLQPVHQLEHISHDKEHSHFMENGLSYESQHHPHCNLCDFIFSPTVQLSVHTIEIPLSFEWIESLNENNQFNSYKIGIQSQKQLRAPPYSA